MVKTKFWFLQNYLWIFIFFLVCMIALGIFSGLNNRLDISIGFLTLFVSSFFFVQKQRIEELRLFQEIFKEFNQRYDNLNNALNEICDKDEGSPISDKERQTLYDYFNLCGEEYFYHKQRHIYPEVWDSWINGMKYFYVKPRIQKVWDEELKQNSYYGFEKSLLK